MRVISIFLMKCYMGVFRMVDMIVIRKVSDEENARIKVLKKAFGVNTAAGVLRRLLKVGRI
jgi:hypothetical protein